MQTISDFALTVDRQDRARGEVVVRPLPNPSEDDGRQLSNLILENVAKAITEAKLRAELIELLARQGRH